MKRIGVGVVVVVLLLFLSIQLVPYGHGHTNPPVSTTPAWDSPRTEAAFARACNDCHSNQTTWPWYSNVAPISWLVQHDVEEGRAIFNISERRMGEAEEAADTVVEGEMPPRDYLLLHPDAQMSDRERQALIVGLRASFGGESDEQETGETRAEDDDLPRGLWCLWRPDPAWQAVRVHPLCT